MLVAVGAGCSKIHKKKKKKIFLVWPRLSLIGSLREKVAEGNPQTFLSSNSNIRAFYFYCV
jgi:hypothetical protein